MSIVDGKPLEISNQLKTKWQILAVFYDMQ